MTDLRHDGTLDEAQPSESGESGFADHWEHLRAEFALLDLALRELARDPEGTSDDPPIAPAAALAELRAGVDDRVAATSADVRLPLARVASVAALTPWEVTLVVLCLGVELDARYVRLCAALQGDRELGRPGVLLALDLLGGGLAERAAGRTALAPEGPLVETGIVRLLPDPRAGSAPLLALTEPALGMLTGRASGPRRPWLRTVPPGRAPADTGAGPLGAHLDPLARAATAVLAGGAWGCGAADTRLVTCLHGAPPAEVLDAVHRVSSRLRVALSVLDLAAVDPTRTSTSDAVREAALVARTEPALLLVLLPRPSDGGSRDGEPAAAARSGLDAVVPEVAEVLDRVGGFTVVGAAVPVGPPAGTRTPWVSLALPQTDPADVARRWQVELTAGDVDADTADASSLASRFRVGPAGIRRVVSTATATARLLDRPPRLADVEAAARNGSGTALAATARRVRSRLSWDDLVLPVEQKRQLGELTAAVRSRGRVMGDWGFGARSARGRGIAALFSGAPGTGKTLAAEIISAQLGLDLYVVDLAAAVSKYIGETEKNLSRVFAAAADTNGLLFFDEADALFGRRSEVKDAHDRYANIEISYLLGRIEAHDGVVVLATNLERHLDEAFLRRLAFAVRFPFPGAAERRRIWQVQVPRAAPVHPDVDWDLLATFQLAGGSIRGAAVHAAYQSAAAGRPIGTVSLLAGVRRELEKLGRVAAPGDFGGHWADVVQFAPGTDGPP